jgi:predicted alpha-1,6-mannanase (GH76 family)
MEVYASNDAQEWRIIRKYSLSFTGRYKELQINGGPSTGFSYFKFILKQASGTKGIRVADIQLYGFPGVDDENLATSENGSISGSAKAQKLQNLIDNDASTTAEILKADREQIDNFDGNKRYNGLINAWFQYEFNEPTAISAYALGMTTSSLRDRRPNCWELQASNDGTEWVTLDIQHNAASMSIDLYEQYYPLGTQGARVNYADVADHMLSFCEDNLERQQGTNGIYWICDWAVNESKRNEDWGGYWWQAHAIDNYIDAYNRTKKSTNLTQITKMISGAKQRNGNTLINHFYDDMEWMALALLRGCDAHTTLNRSYFNQVKTLFNDIVGGWSDVDGGGIHWNKDKTGDGKYKTSCSNGPAMILAARLYQHTQEQNYLDWALRIYEYMYSHNRFPDGVIKDNATNENHEVTFSYNQGTWVGGLLELYKITGEEHYRQTATELIDLLLFGKWYSPKGIMNERQNYNQDDGGMFKGIFVRYLTQWILSGKLDEEHQFRYTKWLLEQARSAELAALNKTWFIINPYWTGQYNINNDVHDTSRQQTGLMLMESIDELRRAGILNEDYSLKNPHFGEAFRYYRLVITETQGSEDILLGSWKLLGEQTATAIRPIVVKKNHIANENGYNLNGIPSRQNTRTKISIINNKKYLQR